MCVRFLKAICEKFFISLLILYCGFLRYVRLLMLGVCMELLMPIMMIIAKRASHPCCASSGCSIVCLLSLRVVASSGNLPS